MGADSNLQTAGDYISWGGQLFDNAGLFFGHGTDNAWDESVELVTFAMGETPFADKGLLQRLLTGEQQAKVLELFNLRISERIPAAYLTGRSWFCGLEFKVNQNVLVPRSPIGELVSHQFQPWLRHPPLRILDLCTGSGCIGIACAHAFADASVILSDISEQALAVAQSNIELHSLQNRIEIIQSDLFNNLQDQTFDLIVTNSPYVDNQDYSSMPDEYHHEPELGLCSGKDGLDFTRRLLKQSAAHLSDQGLLVAEVGNSWIALEKAYPQVPFNWLEFEQGGLGVFVLDKADLPVSD